MTPFHIAATLPPTTALPQRRRRDPSIEDRRFREWLAERRHVVLLFFRDHGQSLNVGGVFDLELEAFPCRTGFSAVKVSHIEQPAQFSMLPDESTNCGHKFLIIRADLLFADMNGVHPSVFFCFEVNGHREFLLFMSGL